MERRRGNRCADVLTKLDGTVFGHARDYDDELITAVACNHAVLHRGRQNHADFLQRPTADHVTVLVIHLLEVVKVEEDHRPLSLELFGFFAKARHKDQLVAGQVIGVLALEDRVVEHHGAGKRREKFVGETQDFSEDLAQGRGTDNR